jgi:hypothetical protein
MLKPLPERRAPTRPKHGDMRLCAFCRVGAMQFHEQPVPDLTPGPAWICESLECGYRTLVRRADRRGIQRSHAEQSRALRDRSVKAHRTAMKVRARSDSLIRRSAKITARRAAKNK